MSTLQEVKKQFMAMRNGVLADQLRVALDPNPYSVIFGLLVPQIAEISRSEVCAGVDPETLWQDRHVRESRLLACYLFRPEEMTRGRAEALMEDIQTQEEADILAFRLLQRLPFAAALAERFAASPDPLERYAALTLERKL